MGAYSSVAFASFILFAPGPSTLASVFAACLIIGVTCCQVFMLGLFSMMAGLRYHPINAKQAFIIGVLSLLALIAAFGCIFRYFGIVDGSSGALDHDPLDCLYFSTVTWTTLGYGDFKPSAGIRLVAALEALIGYIGMVGLLGIAGQYLVARAGMNREEIDKFNKGLDAYVAKKSGQRPDRDRGKKA